MGVNKIRAKRILSMLLIISMTMLSYVDINVKAEKTEKTEITEIKTTETDQKSNFILDTNTQAITGSAINIVNNNIVSDDYEVTFQVTSQWMDGFNANVIIENTSDKVLDNWSVAFAFPHDITNIWNGNISLYENGIYIIKNVGSNQDIAVGQKVNFGFSATYVADIFIPQSFMLLMSMENINDDAYQYDLNVTSNWESAFNADIFITNRSNNVIEDWTIEFDYPNNIERFFTANIIYHKDNRYIVKNAGYNANIKPGETLKLGFCGNPGGILNDLEFLNLMQVVTNTTVLTDDYDQDRLTNEMELYYGTNPYSKDTDFDGIEDFIELMIDFNPLVQDSNDNGIMDGNEDLDDDDLTILQEIEFMTDNMNPDTDWDILTDYEEIYIYGTNPLIADSDRDGINDGSEVKLGLDPLNRDSNQDGVLDGYEKIEQSLSYDILPDETLQITNVQVTMKGTGYIEETTSIENTYGIDSLSSEVVGLIGVPIEINSSSTFDEATITFSYNDELLGNTLEENLRIMWYDEENNQYVIMDEETVLNTKNNTISYTTSHFSTYLVVDRQIWYDVWSNAITYRRQPENPNIPIEFFDICYVIDKSGSMSGSSIITAKEAIVNFIDAMYTHDRGAVIGFDSSAKTYSTFNKDKTILKKAINSIVASGGTSVEAGLVAALNLIDETPPLQVNETSNSSLIILLCDGDVSYSQSTLNRAKNKGIKIYPILIGSTFGQAALQTLANTTGGTFYYAASAEEIREAIWGVQEETIGEIDTTDTDGDGLYDVFEIAGMMLPNGRYIYTDPQKADMDEDGLTDAKEMGITKNYSDLDFLKKIQLKMSGFDIEVYAEYFDYTSDPRFEDSDLDLVKDAEDATPLKKNKKINYVFYEDGGDYFLEWEANDRKSKYKKADRKVEILPVNTLDEFKDEWNSMGLDSNKKTAYQIDEVVTIFHGSPNGILINDDNDANNNLYLTTGASTYNSLSIGELLEKSVNVLKLSSCNNGNLDFINNITIGSNYYTQNVAIAFMKEMPDIKIIQAWDGVASYINIIGYEYASSSERFIEWSMEKNGYMRKPTGKITYSRVGNMIDFSPKTKTEFEIKRMPDNSYHDVNFKKHIIEEKIQ